MLCEPSLDAPSTNPVHCDCNIGFVVGIEETFAELFAHLECAPIMMATLKMICFLSYCCVTWTTIQVNFQP